MPHPLRLALKHAPPEDGPSPFSAPRLAEAFPRAEVLGVDILDLHLDRARSRATHLGDRVHFEHRSVYDLGLPAASFDLTLCRHVLHAIPHAEQAIMELLRVTRPGGVLHLIAEDYGMIHFPVRRFDPRAFWPDSALRFGVSTGTDLLIGRRVPGILAALGLQQVAVHYVVVDTLRVPRPLFAAIWEAWRDGYSEAIATQLGISRDEAIARWDDQIATIGDPCSYAAWLVAVVSGVVAR